MTCRFHPIHPTRPSGPNHRPYPADPWTDPIQQEQHQAVAADPPSAHKEKRRALPSPPTELQAAFEAAAICKPTSATNPTAPANSSTTIIAAADQALSQALHHLQLAKQHYISWVYYTHLIPRGPDLPRISARRRYAKTDDLHQIANVNRGKNGMCILAELSGAPPVFISRISTVQY